MPALLGHTEHRGLGRRSVRLPTDLGRCTSHPSSSLPGPCAGAAAAAACALEAWALDDALRVTLHLLGLLRSDDAVTVPRGLLGAGAEAALAF